MAPRTSVLDLSGNNPETIQQWSKDLGTSKIRRTLFNAVYGRGAKPRSKKQIMEAADIRTSNAQQVQNELDHLASTHLIDRIPNDGSVKDGSRWLYQKLPEVRKYRERIIRFADDRKAANNLVTKRPPAARSITLAKPPSRQALRKRKRLNVLYLSANPDENNRLRLDEEVDRIQKTLRGGVFRDRIHLHYRPAADIESLIDGLNDVRPRIVHFSGHGNELGLALADKRSKKTRIGFISFDMLKKALDATDTPPDIVVLNSCKSADARRVLIPPAKIVIVMRDKISDQAASLFATYFYGGLAGGQSVKKAFEQGKVGIAAGSFGAEETETPDLLAAEGVNPAAMILT